MKYRALTSTGDYQMGQGSAQWLVNTPEAVAQAVQTRLRLMTGEWFLDTTEGTDYANKILGTGTTGSYDLEIRERILDTTGVVSIDEYSSSIDTTVRALTVSATITTIYGTTNIKQVLQ